MNRIELILYSGEHLSTGLYTPDGVSAARKTGEPLQVHGPDDPWPNFGAAESGDPPARRVEVSDIHTWAVHLG